MDVLSELYQTLLERKRSDAGKSYVASLYAKGTDAILKKVAEEAGETVIAAKNPDNAALVHELADLWFHTLVLMAAKDIPLSAVTGELAGRFGRPRPADEAARGGWRFW